MTDKNLLLQDDAFAPPVGDTLEHLPSHHYAKPCDCSAAKRLVCDYCAGYGKEKDKSQ